MIHQTLETTALQPLRVDALAIDFSFYSLSLSIFDIPTRTRAPPGIGKV